jgi:hypothetical protein
MANDNTAQASASNDAPKAVATTQQPEEDAHSIPIPLDPPPPASTRSTSPPPYQPNTQLPPAPGQTRSFGTLIPNRTGNATTQSQLQWTAQRARKHHRDNLTVRGFCFGFALIGWSFFLACLILAFRIEPYNDIGTGAVASMGLGGVSSLVKTEIYWKRASPLIPS